MNITQSILKVHSFLFQNIIKEIGHTFLVRAYALLCPVSFQITISLWPNAVSTIWQNP